MAKAVKYGVISDVHYYPEVVSRAIDVLKQLGAEQLILNGDIGNVQSSIEESQKYVATILDAVGKSGLEAFVQPGSHEMLMAYDPVIDFFAKKYENITDATKIRVHEADGHELVFLPGSDFVCGGEYQIGNDPTLSTSGFIGIKRMGSIELPDKSVKQFEVERSLVMFDKLADGIESVQGMSSLDPSARFEIFRYYNMNDLKRYVKNPEKTVVICHVPRRFDNLKTAVDFAEFGEVTEDFEYEGAETKKGTIVTARYVPEYIKRGCPVVLKKENRGNKDLMDLYNEIGIVKAVSGHFHESSHRANDCNSEHVKEGEFVNELFWNSGHFDAGCVGILTVNGEKASYQNVKLQDYLK